MSSNLSASGKNFFTIEPRSCVLIVIDMQNAFVAEGAVFENTQSPRHDSPPDEERTRAKLLFVLPPRTLTLSPSSRLIAAALS